jgi:hypothetical protein
MPSSKHVVTLLLCAALAACTADQPELGSAQQAIGEDPGADAGKGPTLQTDRVDYLPGETVTFTGAGFAPGETVTITLVENPVQHEPDILSAVADDSGAITNADYAPEQHDVGTLYTATAVGSVSGRTATTGFSDGGSAGGGNIDHYNVTASSGASLVAVGGTRIDSSCDDCTTAVTLPWNFRVYDKVFQTLAVSSNGNVQFQSNNPAYYAQPLNQAPYFAYALAPLWADLWTAPQSGGLSNIGIYTSTTGNQPNRQFHIRWHVTYCCSAFGSTADFELVFFESEPAFDFIYGPVASQFASIGVMKDTTHVTQYAYGSVPPSGTRLHFTGVQATNSAPIANAGPDQTLSCLAHNQEVPVALDGSASSDPDGNTLTYQWLLGQTQLATGVTPTVQLAPGQYNISLSVSDGSLSSTDSVLLSLLEDVLAPVVTINPGPPGVQCGDAYADPGATATDDCAGTINPVVSGAVDSAHVGQYTLTYSATDGNNHTTSTSRTVSVTDTLAPVISVNPGPPGVECATPYTDPGATALDHCVGALPAPADHAIDTSHTGAQTITYTATDGTNSASATRTVSVDDTIAPVISVNPGPPGIECGLPYADPGATASDSCAGDLTASIQVIGQVSTANVGPQQLQYRVTDGVNPASATRNVSVVDTIAPELTLNGAPSVTLQCGVDAYVEAGASARDICVGDLTSFIQISPPPSTAQVGSTTVLYTVTDGHTAPVGAQRAVTVIDTLAPQLATMGNVTVEATGPNGAAAQFITGVASDACDPAPQVTCDHASGETFPLGTTLVTCVASDASGNTTQQSFTVSVVDTTPPTLAQPADVFVTATSIAGAVATFATPSATDIVDQNPSVSCAPASGSTFAPGATTVTCTATDFSGNAAQKTFVVHVSYAWSGFLQPINVDGSSVFKLGSTIPVKFALTGVSASIANLTARIYVAKVANNVTGSEAEAISTASATTGNLFRYDATSGQYIFNLATKGLSTGTWQIRADFGDGVLRTVMVSLK